PKVLRASMGAIFHLNIHENIDLINGISELKKKGFDSYYADMNGTDYREINFNEKCIITFCNEASGPTKELKNNSDYAITIPSKGNIDSLNVSAAAAVILSRL
ncbi:MAG: RNA methyltransferase, partial [Ignavibacteriae bacterium]|nr:RNA methyltransferase [Ignavibacteriota bacterium]